MSLNIIPIANAYDDSTFISEVNSRRERAADFTCRPTLPASEERGYDFNPLEIEDHEPFIEALPTTPLQLFLRFLPLSLVERWVIYTNEWAIYQQNRHRSSLKPRSRLLQWIPTTASEIYTWIALMLYIGIHRETNLRAYWKSPILGQQGPSHSIKKYMTYERFSLLFRLIRIAPPSDALNSLSRTFQYVNEWSSLIQHTTALLYKAGLRLSIDECIIRFTGRSREKTRVPNKPTPVGLKIWVVAQQGLFLRWIWHKPGQKYGSAAVAAACRARRRELLFSKSSRRIAKQPKSRLSLNPTQAVVVALVNQLPKGTHHVFFDNLFTSPNLLRALRRLGHGATGTARQNSGLFARLKVLKTDDSQGRNLRPFNSVLAIPTADNLVGSLIQEG